MICPVTSVKRSLFFSPRIVLGILLTNRVGIIRQSIGPVAGITSLYAQVIDRPYRDDILKINMNYLDNPFFPEVLRKEMEYDKRTDYDKYLHIWEGKCQKHSDAQVFFIIRSLS